MARIIVSVINDLETDQRVDKVCSTLHESGHDLLLVGRRTKFSGQLNRKYAFKRMRLLFSKGPLFYAEFNFRLFLLLLFVKAEVLLSNDLDTLLANYLASRIRRKELVYDSHEYFTEVPELRGRFAKSIWERIEKWIFPKLRNVYTVNGSLAKIYADKYNVDVKVVQNLPRNLVSENNFEREYLLYQGAINVGRGLEEIVSAMEKIAVPLIIVGEGDIKQSLKRVIREKGLEDRITLMDRVSPEKLRELTLKAKIGFNLLEDASLNYRYSLANKFFDYIQAEVPVVTMKFPEYERIFEIHDVGIMLHRLDADSIINAVDHLLKNEVFDQKLKHIKAAKKEFIWEKEEPKLKRIFAQF